MTPYHEILQKLPQSPKIWLITGVAGFIGSNLLETLLKLDQHVVGLDNFSTGYQDNLDQVKNLVSSEQWDKFQFIQGDIREIKSCQRACAGVDYVLHQAALGSVPRSLADPIATNAANVSGFLNMLVAARDAKVKSFIYAASSSTYGDHPALPKVEENIGKPLSPYAVTKYVNELYAEVFSKCYGFHTVGLRYFNVFGPRQNPNGAYAAVIPKWILTLIKDEEIIINGKGDTSRDFTYIANIIQANILSALKKNKSKNEVFNIASGGRISLNELYELIKNEIIKYKKIKYKMPNYKNYRDGDVKHSQADITKAKRMLGYFPEYEVKKGIKNVVAWHIKNNKIN